MRPSAGATSSHSVQFATPGPFESYAESDRNYAGDGAREMLQVTRNLDHERDQVRRGFLPRSALAHALPSSGEDRCQKSCADLNLDIIARA